jgi:uncharacterized protein (DUF1800 family)
MSDSVALLLRRACFGPTGVELADATRAGYEATVAKLIAPTGPDRGAAVSPMPDLGRDAFDDLSDPTADQRLAAESRRIVETEAIFRWWLDRMTVADHQAHEKLLFFWHGHWATSIRGVGSPQFMLAQHDKIRSSATFPQMARKLVVDPALVYWLDGEANSKDAPNENLARELMELFTLGIGNYTEADIKEAARALTGWKTDLGVPQTAILVPKDHDPGSKTILGRTAKFDAFGVADLLTSQPACPRFLAARLWFRYGSSDQPVPEPTRARIAAAYPSPLGMLRALLLDDEFRSGRYRMVKQPVEWLVGAMRQLGVRPADFSPGLLHRVAQGLEGMGQVPFVPPSVGGWPSGAAWLTTAAVQARLNLADAIVGPAHVDRMSLEDMARMLAVDTWTNRTYQALKGTTDPRRLLTLGLVSPEYVVT